QTDNFIHELNTAFVKHRADIDGVFSKLSSKVRMVESAAGFGHVGDHKFDRIFDALFLLVRMQRSGHKTAAETRVAGERFHLIEDQNVFYAGFQSSVSGGESGKTAADDN